MIVTQLINVHLDKQTIPTVEAVQSDTGRAVQLSLYSQGTAWTVPTGTVGIIRYSIFHEGECYTSVYDTLADGSSAVSSADNVLTVGLTPEVLSIVGVGQLQVELRWEDQVIATLSVLLRVQRDLSLEGITPATFSNLTTQIRDEVLRQTQAAVEQNSWLDALHHRIDAELTAGTLDSGDGTEVDSTTRIRSGYISHGGREITVIVPAGVKVRCLFYDSDYAYKNESSFYTDSFTIHNGQAFVRLVAGYTDDGEVTDTDALAQLVGIFYASDSFDDYRGHVTALGYDSFAACTAPGYYRFAGADVAAISDAPDITVGGILQVRSHCGTNVMFQTILTTDGQIWFRWGSRAFTKLLPTGEKLRWYSLGDSIAQGYYYDSNGLQLDSSNGWAAVAARENGWSLSNQAVGGSGYVQPATVGDGLNARDHVDTIDFSDAELVTLAYGVNDWKGNCPLGSMSDDVAAGGTFYSNMRYCIEKILSDQPCARVVVISPINCCAYGTTEDNWGIGYEFDGGTLEEFFAAECEICAYYGIEFVDLLHGSTVNRINAPEVLADGVHPSLACHRLLGIEIAGKLK